MTEWNFDMSQAPRGHWKTVNRGKGTADLFVPAKIIATDGDIVTVSYWIPAKEKPVKTQERWAMFATGQTPMAWMPWPDPPEGETP